MFPKHVSFFWLTTTNRTADFMDLQKEKKLKAEISKDRAQKTKRNRFHIHKAMAETAAPAAAAAIADE